MKTTQIRNYKGRSHGTNTDKHNFSLIGEMLIALIIVISAAGIPGIKVQAESDYNADEVSQLTDFALLGNNLDELGWDLDVPSTWEGVFWKNIDGVYSVYMIDLYESNVEGALDVSGFENLQCLWVISTNISVLDASDCKKLTLLDCQENKLEYLKVNGCTELQSLCCDNNLLATLDLNGLGMLSGVSCNNNQLQSINLEHCRSIYQIRCANNYLSGAEPLIAMSDMSELGLHTGATDISGNNFDFTEGSEEFLYLSQIKAIIEGNSGRFLYGNQTAVASDYAEVTAIGADSEEGVMYYAPKNIGSNLEFTAGRPIMTKTHIIIVVGLIVLTVLFKVSIVAKVKKIKKA